MKHLIILLLCSITALFLQAQDYQVNWGPRYNMKIGYADQNEFLGIHGDHYYILSHNRKAAILQQFDLNHKLLREEPFIFQIPSNEAVIGGSVRTNAGSFIYLYTVDRDRQEWALYVSRFNNGQFRRPVLAYKEIFDVKNKQISEVFESYQNYGGPPLIVSPDSTHVAFVDIMPSLDYRDDDVVATAVFDNQMNLVWQAAWFYKFSKKDFEITQSAVSDKGELYLTGWTHVKRKGKKRGLRSVEYLPEYEYKLFKVTAQDMTEEVVDIGEYVAPLDAKLFFSKTDPSDFVVAGFYTDDNAKSRMKGLFFCNGNTRQGILDKKLNEFKPSFLKNLASDKAIKKDKGLDMTYRILDILHFGDGTMGFIAEDNYEVETNTVDPYYGGYYYGYNTFRYNPYNSRFNRQITYHSNDIIIPLFDKEGNLLNIQKIYKDYRSSVPSYTSYLMAHVRDKVYLIFNDFKSGEEKKKLDKKKGRNYTDLVVLDSQGNIESQQNLFNDHETELEFVTRWYDANRDVILLGTMERRSFAFGTIPISN